MVSIANYSSDVQSTVHARETSDWPSAITDLNHPTLVIKEDDLFLITDPLGNVTGRESPAGVGHATPTITGLFCRDSRFLSRSELQIDGQLPILLGNQTVQGFAMEVVCTNPCTEGKLPAEKIAIRRRICLRGALFETIEVKNHTIHSQTFQLSLSLGADFRDLFEVRQYAQRSQRGMIQTAIQPDAVLFSYEGLCETPMESRIEFVHQPPDSIVQNTLIWNLQLEGQACVELGYRLIPQSQDIPLSQLNAAESQAVAFKASMLEQQRWLESTTQVRSNNDPLNQVIEQAELDIYLLLQSFDGRKVLTAGMPWYSTLFGRDAIIAAQQTLMLDHQIARDTLLTLAEFQGQDHSDWHDEKPGKIMHELRLGEMARCHEIPHTPYYGTVDATPLWLLLYGDYYDWTGDEETFKMLWPHALAAMDWIESTLDERGYLSYEKRSQRGLDNQGWKDSHDCIVDGTGEIAEGAIALCEVQAYVYGAYRRMAEFATQFDRGDLATHWSQQADALKQRFNRDFWVENRNFVALALTCDGSVVDSITSNPGHCLSLGILDPEKADAVATRMLNPELFSGWGIRTLSTKSKAYNPMSYHMGSIWPHDNALIAVGLRSLGYRNEAFQIAQALFEMTQLQPYSRPPELFCGYERQRKQAPVSYPVACSPQAWASGSIVQLLQLMLNPEPDAVHRRLTLRNPALPQSLESLYIGNLTVGDAVVDLMLRREGSETICEVIQKSGDLEIVIINE